MNAANPAALICTWMEKAMLYAKVGALATLLLATSACSDMSNQQQRALSGGAIGAGGGALLGWAVGGSPLIGAVVGGAGGAAVGALTSNRNH
jgi:osmotically inducible lipoprotein OsmB